MFYLLYAGIIQRSINILRRINQYICLFNKQAASSSCIRKTFLPCFCTDATVTTCPWRADASAGAKYYYIHMQYLFFTFYIISTYIYRFILHRPILPFSPNDTERTDTGKAAFRHNRLPDNLSAPNHRTHLLPLPLC